MRLILIDNYDSFTFNLVHLFGKLGAEVDVVRNDVMTAAEVLDAGFDAIVLSPGPCTPNEAGICLDLVHAAQGIVPLFGVCLGHQSIGQALGGTVRRASPMHGKVSTITHTGRGLFKGLNGPLAATRYHSLVVERADLPGDLVVSAETEDGLIMAMEHRSAPLWGVQFHPESIATEAGAVIAGNFLRMAREFGSSRPASPIAAGATA